MTYDRLPSGAFADSTNALRKIHPGAVDAKTADDTPSDIAEVNQDETPDAAVHQHFASLVEALVQVQAKGHGQPQEEQATDQPDPTLYLPEQPTEPMANERRELEDDDATPTPATPINRGNLFNPVYPMSPRDQINQPSDPRAIKSPWAPSAERDANSATLPTSEPLSPLERLHTNAMVPFQDQAKRGSPDASEVNAQDQQDANPSAVAHPPPFDNRGVVLSLPSVPPIQSAADYRRGIILCLHNGIVEMGASLIRELRCLGNMEIIQVYHCFPDELSPYSRKLLTMGDPRVQLIDVCTAMMKKKKMDEKLAKTFKSYWIKPLALYHTNLTEVLLLDADVIAMRDPAIIRTAPGYRRTGTVFFYDRVVKKNTFFNKIVNVNEKKNSPKKQYLKLWVELFPYKRFNLTGPRPSAHLQQSFVYRELTAHEQDSSMVAVDKSRSKKPLEIMWYLITEKRFRFKFSWGDKEAFWLSWEFSHAPYFFSPWGISAIESASNEDVKNHPDTMCGNMAHYMPVSEPIPELLYVNGRSMLEPYPVGPKRARASQRHFNVFNFNPSRMTPRQKRRLPASIKGQPSTQECLTGMGSTELPDEFYRRLMRRRMHLFAIKTNFSAPLQHCDDIF
ncbi:TPA: hypothetical protein N0F65_006421 [Lagenidium giganteum]|uniref:Glycosyltransferase family 8 protein n=1 Tax=Lagenidium giganteum TaxID=4803 RepID=A0AAV2Z1I0_9STRA|nr:TPA: hypothetical protein N0F65_006421 [Lagenidium giganteum]